MKNRFVPFYLVIAFLGLSLLFQSALSVAGQPGNPEPKKQAGTGWDNLRVNQNTGTVNPFDVTNARSQAEAMNLKSTASGMGLNWQSMGPDNFTGMIWSALFDNTDASGLTIIAGAAKGGIWKSVDLGLTWNPMAVDGNSVPVVSSMVQTSNGTIYAATGVSTCKTIKFEGNGIYRSVSGGAFSLIASTASNPDFKAVLKLAVSPQGKIYAATYGGLYATDNGDEWVKILDGYAMDVAVGSDGTVLAGIGESAYLAPAGDFNAKVTLTSGLPNALPATGIGWMTFAIAPSDVNVMYASLADVNGKLMSVYTSEDKGATWSVAFPNNPTYEPFSGYGCYSNVLAVFPNDPGKIYLGSRDMWYGKKVAGQGFFNWERVSFGTQGAYSPFFVPLYHHSYMFRPNVPNQLVVASDGGVSVGTLTGEDITFQTSNKNFRTTQFTSLAISNQKTFAMGGGPRIGTLALGFFCPKEISFTTNGYQVWRQDASSLPLIYQPQPANYGGNGGTCIWSNIDSRVAIYTKGGQDTVRRQDFTDINNLNNFSMGIKTDTTGRVPMCSWETFNQQAVFGITRDSATYIAEQIAVPVDSVILIQSNSNRVLFPYKVTAPLAKGDTLVVADPLATRFFICGDKGSNRGIFMTKEMIKFRDNPFYYMVFKDNLSNDPISAIAVSPDLNTVWAGTSKGRLIRLTGLVNAWDSATANILSSQCVITDTIYSGLPFAGRAVTSITMNPNNSAQVLVTLGNYGNQDYVYYCANGSSASPVFTSVTGNLPKAPVYSAIFEITSGNVIVGTDVGAYSSSSATSGNWSPEYQGIGIVPVTGVMQQTATFGQQAETHDYHILNFGVIYISTYGRGIWMDDSRLILGTGPAVTSTVVSGDVTLNPNPASNQMTMTYQNPATDNLVLNVFDMTGHMVYTRDLGVRQQGKVSFTIDVNGLSHGAYVLRIGNSQAKFIKQ